MAFDRCSDALALALTGNFLLMPDDRIGLIDFGQTKRFTRNERLCCCVLFAALGRRDEQMLKTLVQVLPASRWNCIRVLFGACSASASCNGEGRQTKADGRGAAQWRP